VVSKGFPPGIVIKFLFSFSIIVMQVHSQVQLESKEAIVCKRNVKNYWIVG
jgi:hypothetical protein